MIVWFAHVKVGHRQTPHNQKPRPRAGAFAFRVATRRLPRIPQSSLPIPRKRPTEPPLISRHSRQYWSPLMLRGDISKVSSVTTRQRRRFSREFKRQLVDQCTPGVPFAGIALSHGISANLLRRRIGKFRIDVNLTGWYGQHIDRDTGSALSVSHFQP